MVAGMKQAKRSRLPELARVESFESMVSSPAVSPLRLIAHEGADPNSGILNIAETIAGAPDLTVLIGPEGGFSKPEIDLAERFGWRVVSLGQARLRTETAAIVAAAAVHLIKTTMHGSRRTKD
jgi:16S rRNA (uracil1498-N3)-methyltransferase